MVLFRTAVASLVILSACSVGEVPAGGGGIPDAGGGGMQAAQFTSTITPLLNSKNCVSCHTGGQVPTFTSYTALQAKYKMAPAATNPLITEAGNGAPHNGVPYFTTAEKATVSKWIEGTL